MHHFTNLDGIVTSCSESHRNQTIHSVVTFGMGHGYGPRIDHAFYGPRICLSDDSRIGQFSDFIERFKKCSYSKSNTTANFDHLTSWTTLLVPRSGW